MPQSISETSTDPSGGNSSIDPVCGMQASGEITLMYKEKTYAFCSDHCRQQFQKDPEHYIK